MWHSAFVVSAYVRAYVSEQARAHVCVCEQAHARARARVCVCVCKLFCVKVDKYI